MPPFLCLKNVFLANYYYYTRCFWEYDCNNDFYWFLKIWQ